MGDCVSWFERTCGPLDEVFGYQTQRTLIIKDRWLGAGLIICKLAILGWVVGFQVIVEQQYRALAATETSVRFQLRAPNDKYRWPVAGVMPAALAGMGAPYCTGVTALSPQHPLHAFYTISEGRYTYSGVGAPSPTVPQLQRDCEYLDAVAAAPFPETDRVFLASELSVTDQRLTTALGVRCSDQASPACNWSPFEERAIPAVTQRSYVADVEMFTVLIDHNFVALDRPSFSRTSREMKGFMRSASGELVNPCRPYAAFPGGCPDIIAVGNAGKPDIVSFATILEAAGVTTLDVPSTELGSKNSVREGGLVILLEITYSNYFHGVGGTGSLFSEDEIVYTYSASVVPQTEFKIETAELNVTDATARAFLNRHGIRIMINTEGRVGYFDLQTLFINLTVALGLLAVSVLLMEFIVFTCCPLRAVYKQYKERQTVDMSELRALTRGQDEALKSLLEHFKDDPFAVDPPPPALANLMGERVRRKSLTASKRAASAASSDVELATLPSPGGGARVRSNPLAATRDLGSVYDQLPGAVVLGEDRAAQQQQQQLAGAAAAVPDWHAARTNPVLVAHETAAAAAALQHSQAMERALAEAEAGQAATRAALDDAVRRKAQLEDDNRAFRAQRLRALSSSSVGAPGNPFAQDSE